LVLSPGGLVLAAIAGLAFVLMLRRRKRHRLRRQAALLVEKLEQAGFFVHCAGDVSSLKKRIVETGYVFQDDLGRVFPADAEDLAEEGVLDFLAELSPFLARQGVHLPVKEVLLKTRKARDPETGAVIDIQPRRRVIDDTLEGDDLRPYLKPIREHIDESVDRYVVEIGVFRQEIWSDRTPSLWEAATCNTLVLVNRLLLNAGSAELAFGLYGGNEGEVVFLTQEQFDLIEASNLAARDRPWRPYSVE
jgi:hypothetical protein